MNAPTAIVLTTLAVGVSALSAQPPQITNDRFPNRNRLVIPMNDWNAIAIVELDAPSRSRQSRAPAATR